MNEIIFAFSDSSSDYEILKLTCYALNISFDSFIDDVSHMKY